MNQKVPNHRSLRLLVLLCLSLGVFTSAAAGPLQDDVKARRARLMERLGPETIGIFMSAPSRVYSADIDYEYRQDSNLLYLTGIDQEETILVLMPGNQTQKELLFVRDADARREHRNGHSKGPPGLAEVQGHRVRIEDSYLLTAAGLERLSASVPRTIDAIESFLKQSSTARR